jgi:hypothetical protein
MQYDMTCICIWCGDPVLRTFEHMNDERCDVDAILVAALPVGSIPSAQSLGFQLPISDLLGPAVGPWLLGTNGSFVRVGRYPSLCLSSNILEPIDESSYPKCLVVGAS